MDESILEKALFFPVRAFLIMIPYVILASVLGGISVLDQFKVVLLAALASIVLFFIDLFMQTFLDQDRLGRLVYFVFLGVMLVFAYYLIYPAYLYLLNGRGGLSDKIWTGVHLYILIYFLFTAFKRFFSILWDLDIV